MTVYNNLMAQQRLSSRPPLVEFERHCSVNNSNVPDGLRNVTEGVPSLPPVESKDTAYEPKSKVTDRYAMRAPGRTRSNVKEGGSVDSNDTERVTSLPPVESKDTAYKPKSKVTNCYTMRAPGHTRSNVKEGGIILEVPMDDEDDYFSEAGHNWDKRIESYISEQIPLYPISNTCTSQQRQHHGYRVYHTHDGG
jgi:hypothetical protein